MICLYLKRKVEKGEVSMVRVLSVLTIKPSVTVKLYRFFTLTSSSAANCSLSFFAALRVLKQLSKAEFTEFSSVEDSDLAAIMSNTCNYRS